MKRKINTQTIFENTGATKQDKKQAKTLVGVAARKKGKEWGGGGVTATHLKRKEKARGGKDHPL